VKAAAAAAAAVDEDYKVDVWVISVDVPVSTGVSENRTVSYDNSDDDS